MSKKNLESKTTAHNFGMNIYDRKDGDYLTVQVTADKYGEGQILFKNSEYYAGLNTHQGTRIPICLKGMGKSKSERKVRRIVLGYMNQQKSLQQYLTAEKILNNNKRVYGELPKQPKKQK